MENKKQFVKPSMEKVEFSDIDVIVTSGNCSYDCPSAYGTSCSSHEYCNHTCSYTAPK